LAATVSRWSSQDTAPAADLLPSAALPSAQISQSPPAVAPAPAVPAATSGRSRTVMTIGLAVAAVALVATVVYLTMSQSSSVDDPTDVKLGAEQREYGDDPEPAKTATARPTAPKAVPRVPFKFKKPTTSPKPTPRKEPEDIYDDL